MGRFSIDWQEVVRERDGEGGGLTAWRRGVLPRRFGSCDEKQGVAVPVALFSDVEKITCGCV